MLRDDIDMMKHHLPTLTIVKSSLRPALFVRDRIKVHSSSYYLSFLFLIFSSLHLTQHIPLDHQLKSSLVCCLTLIYRIMAKIEQVKRVMDEVYGRCLDPRNWAPKKYKDTKSRYA